MQEYRGNKQFLKYFIDVYNFGVEKNFVQVGISESQIVHQNDIDSLSHIIH